MGWARGENGRTSTVWLEGLSGGRVRGRLRLGWIDGVVALGGRGMTVEAVRQCEKDREEWRALVHMLNIEFNAANFVWPCVLPNRPLVDYHTKRDGMPLKRHTY